MRNPRRLPAALLATSIVSASALLGQAAHGAEVTVTYSASLPSRATDWADSVALPRFDPSLGELRTVDLHVEAHLDGTMGYENLTASSATLDATLAAIVTVSRPAPAGDVITIVQPSVSRTDTVEAYDGILDHDGASGRTYVLSDDEATTPSLTGAADLALFTGLTPLLLPTTGADASAGPLGLGTDSQLTTQVSAEVTVTYTYVADSRPPDAPTIDSSPSAFTADPAPVVTFTAEAGATTECQLDTPVSAGTWATCTSPWQADLATADDGAYTFSVRAIDLAGNVGEAAVRSFTLDRVAPAQPTFATTPPPLGQSPHPTWAFTIEAGAVARCALDGSPSLPCSSPFVADLTLSADGAHTLTVVAVDSAGNTGPPISDTYELDRVAPAPPSITLAAPSPGNDPTPTWAFDLAPGAVAATCSIDGGGFASCTSPFTANLAGAADGDHTFAVRNNDPADNQSAEVTSTYRLDQEAPSAPLIFGPASPSNVVAPVWIIITEDWATTECRLDAGAWVLCPGSFTTTFGASSDGVHILTVRATDAAGNMGAEATATYTLDTTAPGPAIITAAPANPSNSPNPTWSFTTEPGSHASCSVDGGAWNPCTSPLEVDLTSAADGLHLLAVRATDAQGNVGPAATSGFVLDRTAPTAPTITAAPPSPGHEATVTWGFTTPEGTTAACRVDGGDRMPCADALEVTFADDGVHRLLVSARDAAGNFSASATATYRLDRVAPVAPMITGAPSSPARVTTPQWTFRLDHQSTGECSIDGGTWVPCATSFSADLSAAGDGSHTFAVRSIDDAGNVGDAALGLYVLDRTPPSPPEITGGPGPHSADDTPTWTFVVGDGDAAQCRVDDGTWATCTGSLSPDLTAALDGTHSLEVRATDVVGNVGPTSVTAYELDRVDPVEAAFTATPLSPGHEPAPQWAFTFEPGTTAWCSIDGGATEACDGTYAADLAIDGVHELAVTVVDAAGNASDPVASRYELDRVAPGEPVLTAPRSPDRDAQPEWGIDLEPGSVARCSFDGGPFEGCGAVFTIDLADQDGLHQLEVVARDAAGNASAAAISAYLLDTIAPGAPVLLHTPDRALWAWRFALDPSTTAECSVDGEPWAGCVSPLTAGAADRTVRFEVRAIDRAGNRSTITGTTVTPTLADDPAVPPVVPPPVVGPATSASSGAPDPDPSPVVAPLLPRRVPASAPVPAGEGRSIQEARSLVQRFRQPDRPYSSPVAGLFQAAAEKTTIPMLVVLIVLGFVAVQNRIDRRDPKLAAAPLRNEPEYMEFK